MPICSIYGRASRHLGYAGACELFKPIEFRLPQTRERVYFVLLRLDTFNYSAAQAEAKGRAMMRDALGFRQPMEPIERFLFDCKDPVVLAERERRRLAASGDHKGPPTWKETHIAHMSQKGFS